MSNITKNTTVSIASTLILSSDEAACTRSLLDSVIQRILPSVRGKLACMVLTGVVSASYLPLSASEIQLPEADEQTTFFHSLGRDAPFERVPEKRELEFAEGLVPNTEALNLTDDKSPESGVSFLIDTTPLEEGTIEIWINPLEDVLPPQRARTILNLGTAGNTKLRLEFRESRVRLIFALPGQEKAVTLTSSPIDIGEWNHVAVAWSPETGLKLFINGHLAAERHGNATFWATSQKELLHVGDAQEYNATQGRGWFSADNNFIGRLAYLRISNLARSSFPNVHSP